MDEQLFPKLVITPKILALVAEVTEVLGRLSVEMNGTRDVMLRRASRIRTVQASLQIEGNSLSLDQVTAVLDGKKVVAPLRDIQEVRNAIHAYEKLDQWKPDALKDLLDAHKTLMRGLIDHPGCFRTGSVGIQGKGNMIVHVAPPAQNVPTLVSELFRYLKTADYHPLLKSCIFHYEFEFIHPFMDGNGRLGRLWQTLILQTYNPIFALFPVESIVRDRQSKYYQALRLADSQGNAAPFIEFMLDAIRDAISEYKTQQDTPQVALQVNALIDLLKKHGEMSRSEIQTCLKLKDRENLRQRYLVPALEAGLIEYTIPDKPNSRNQKYRLVRK